MQSPLTTTPTPGPLACVLAMCLTACHTNAPDAAQAASPAAQVLPPANAVTRPTERVRSVNFESIDLKTTCGDLGNVRLHEGAARTEDWEARIDHVVFGDLTGDDLEEAVVVATCTTGGTAGPIPEYHVFGFVDDRLHPMAVIQGGSKMLDPDSVRIEQRTLVITRWFQDGNAMPLREQTETLRWNGKAFDRKKITARTQLDVGQER